MEVILLEKVANVGNLGDKVTVKPGFGRNYLIPYNKAVRATKANIADFEARRAELEKKAADRLAAAQERAQALAAKTVTIAAKAGDEGKLYGSVGVRELAIAIKAAGIDVNKSEILLPEGPIHYIGEFDIALQLHSDVEASVKVSIVAE